MKTYQVPYGRGHQDLILPDDAAVDVIDPADQPASQHPLDVVEEALDHPLGGRSLSDFRGAKTVAIAVNDKTRPVPHQFLLPPLLKRLEQLGFASNAIQLLIATGTHLPMTPDEFEMVLPEEILARYPVYSHDCDARDLVYLGQTSYQTEAWENRRFHEAGLRIVVGNIEPHHFAGFSGGLKTAAIGLAGRQTINHNHTMLVDPLSRIGEYDRNPLRQDIEEIGAKMDVQFALNAVLNGQKQIIQAFWGEPMSVMSAGMQASRRVTQTEVDGLYDLVITSPGGYPKDINFYQAQKALTYADQVTKEGGTIVLAAACPEGSGSQSYEDFMEGLDSYEQVFEKFKAEGFRVGPHKALQVALIASHKRVIVVSQIPPEWIYRWLMIPAPDLQSAFELVRVKLPAQPRIAVLPHATNTIPVVSGPVSLKG